MNFRTKTALTIAVLTALALGGAFAMVWETFNGLQRRQLDQSLLDVANDEAREAPSNGFAFDDRPGPAANDVGPLTKYGVIYGQAGHVLSATPPFDAAPPALSALRHPFGEAFDLRFGGAHLRGVLVAVPEHPRKVLFLATSREDLDGDEAFLFKAMLAAFLASVAWASAVAYWMAGRLARAHHAIAEAVRNVARGDLSSRVRVQSNDPEVVQLGRDIDEMVEQLGELLESQQRFIAHAAHELRSPLAALYGELQQAVRKERTSEEYKLAIEAALTAARRLKVLADDLLLLARTRAEGSIHGDPIPLENAVSEARAVVDSIAREHGVELRVDVGAPCSITSRNGDTARMLRNLLENAVRHAPRGSVVRLEARVDPDRVRLAVSDDGPGVPNGEREAIFEPFFRSKGANRGDGAGLGLSIAREIARAHGGDVVLDDARAGGRTGATFIVSLERAPASPSLAEPQ